MISRNGRSVVGFGLGTFVAPRPGVVGQNAVAMMVASPSPWTVALVTTVVGAAAGWAIEEVARTVRGKRES